MTGAKVRDWVAVTARDAAWAPVLVFLGHVVAARGSGAYDRWPPPDSPMHALGGIANGSFLHRAGINASTFGLIGPHHGVTHVDLVATAVVTWEFAEFPGDRCFGTHAHVDQDDSLLDMLLGILGGVALLAASHGPDPA